MKIEQALKEIFSKQKEGLKFNVWKSRWTEGRLSIKKKENILLLYGYVRKKEAEWTKKK